MQLTRAADYAVRMMIHLATLPPGRRVCRSELAQAGEIPEQFVSKVMQQLVRSQLAMSRRGGGGGFELGRPPGEITLLDVVEAMEGPVCLNACLQAGPSCGRKGWCAAHLVWAEAQQAMTEVLRRATIADLAARSQQAAGSGESPLGNTAASWS